MMMLPKRYYFLLIFPIFFAGQNFSQGKEIKSNADLPLLNFSTQTLHPEDTASVNAWMKSISVKELPHVDSILRNCKIINPRLKVYLSANRLFCNFILGNWNDLTYADTLFRQISGMPTFIRQSGLPEFSAYGKAKLGPSSDFNRDYISFLSQYLQSLSMDDRQTAMAAIVARLSSNAKSANGDINKIKAGAMVGDTSLFFIGEYCFQQLNLKVQDLLLGFYNKMIAEKFTRADTLRGTISAERSWWDVLRYDITVKPDLTQKTIVGINNLQYRVVNDKPYSIEK